MSTSSVHKKKVLQPPVDIDIDNDKPWMKMKLDEERNPFAQLERDFPSFRVSGSSDVQAKKKNKYPDLLLVRDLSIFQ